MGFVTVRLGTTIPALPSSDLARSIDFYRDRLGFELVLASCRIQVEGVDELFAACSEQGIVHLRGGLADQWWGSREFGILDPDGNLLTFFEER